MLTIVSARSAAPALTGTGRRARRTARLRAGRAGPAGAGEPGVQTVNQLFGTAIHAVMQSLHNYAGSEDHPGKLPPIEQTYQVFRTSFRTTSLDEATTRKWSAKGRAIIDAYYKKRSESFRPNQRAELRLEATISDGVRLNGKLDAVEIGRAHV